MANFTRRKFIQAAGGVAAVSTLGFPAIVGAASKKVVVVGGGNSAAQHALTLSRIAKQVYLICRSENPGIDAAQMLI